MIYGERNGSPLYIGLRPPRSNEVITSFKKIKTTEGFIFEGYLMNPKLLSDLDLGGSDDLKTDLRGHLRPLRPKLPFSPIFNPGP